MRIVLTLLSGIGYGGMTYFRGIIPALAALNRQHEYHCVVPEGHPLIAAARTPTVTFHAVVRAETSALSRFRYEQLELPGLLRNLRADVCYTAKNLAVFRAPCAVVTAIRNMEPFRYREFGNAWSLDVQSRMKWELTKRSVARADAIVAVSQAVRSALIERFPEAVSKIHVVYNGNSMTSTESLRATEGSEAIPLDEQRDCHVARGFAPRSDVVGETSFLLTASKFVAYANQLALVEGYARLRAMRPHTPPLAFAGGIHDARYFATVQRRVAELGLTEHVRFLGLLPQEDLHDRMRTCAAFVFPSMLESCPHTLLEAMACGAPIATSTTAPMPEICGDAATYFDPHDPDAIARTLSRLLDDAALRDCLVAKGRSRAAEFTWEKTARGLTEVFERVVARTPAAA